MKWAQKELDYLITNYSLLSAKAISQKLQRTKSAVFAKANLLDLKSSNINNKKCKIDFLLSDKLESFYWIGYLLADGSFMNNRSINLTCAANDKEQLNKFSNLCGSKVREYTNHAGFLPNRIMCEVNCYDYILVPKITEKFDIKSRKTYNAPNMDAYEFNANQIMALIVGFIDGDGCISNFGRNKKYLRLTIQNHHSWFDNLCFINKTIHNYFQETIENEVKVDSRGYANLAIGKSKLLKGLKAFVVNYELPVLDRKWECVV